MRNNLLMAMCTILTLGLSFPVQAMAYWGEGENGYHFKNWEGEGCYEEAPVVEESGGGNVLLKYIHLLSPNYGGEVLGQGAGVATTQSGDTTVIWESYSYGVDYVNLLYSVDQGASWHEIVAGYPNTGSYNWHLPLINSNHVLLRISAFGADGTPYGSDITNVPFTILNFSD
ncbi:MAG: hypothetical protein WC570_00340 [Patescibacteria group bacterium]